MKIDEQEYERLKNRDTRKIVKDSAAHPSPYLERTLVHDPVAEKARPRFNKAVNIHVHHRTNRAADPDGRSLKAAIDGLVESGILAGDSTKFVKEITQSQEVVKGGEETIIEIREV